MTEVTFYVTGQGLEKAIKLLEEKHMNIINIIRVSEFIEIDNSDTAMYLIIYTHHDKI